MSLAAWLALAASAVILLLVVGRCGGHVRPSNALREGSIVDMILFVALVVLVGSILTMLARQTQALRKLKSAERARAMASQLARLDSAGSGTRLLRASCRRSTPTMRSCWASCAWRRPRCSRITPTAT